MGILGEFNKNLKELENLTNTNLYFRGNSIITKGDDKKIQIIKNAIQFLCDQYIIYPPNVETNWVVDYGDIITIEAEADGDVYWMDENLNIINNGLFN